MLKTGMSIPIDFCISVLRDSTCHLKCRCVPIRDDGVMYCSSVLVQSYIIFTSYPPAIVSSFYIMKVRKPIDKESKGWTTQL